MTCTTASDLVTTPTDLRLHAGDLTLPDAWQLAPGTRDGPPKDDGGWLPATVPGTVAAALDHAGTLEAGRDLDSETWWYRIVFPGPDARAGDAILLCFDGLATVAEVFLNGRPLLRSDSMWRAHEVEVTDLLERENRLEIRFDALTPLLARTRRPRQRWRTQLVPDGSLRWFRTALLGRATGLGPVPAPVGPWRPVRLVRRCGPSLTDLELRSALDGDDGVLSVRACVIVPPGQRLKRVAVRLDGPGGAYLKRLRVSGAPGARTVAGVVRVPDVATWWPHTHGQPHLYAATVTLVTGTETTVIAAGKVGFRTLAAGADALHDVEADGLEMHVNGVPVFVRGAVWTPPDPLSLNPTHQALRATLTAARDAGLNLLRIAGTMHYETDVFHAACDELGILVWQDLMFANLDYPFTDPQFAAAATEEANAVVRTLSSHPSFAVLCGNSEVEQQVAMMGLDATLGRGTFFGETVPSLLAAATSDALYVPSAPCGGARPFVPDRGVANWFGVGGYGRPVCDTRRAGVRFASECLALANVPGEDVVAVTGMQGGVPRDPGADWDFASVRDAYLGDHYGVDVEGLRAADPTRYLDLSRALTGELMAAVFGEWRRAASPCHGGIVLWWRDVVPGSGWGLLDHRGVPKAAYHHLRRALAPVALWIVDEGLGGLRLHVANDPAKPLTAGLVVSVFRDGEQPVRVATRTLEVPGAGAIELDLEEVLGGFLDIGHAYRFGPLGHDLVVARLQRADGELLSQVCRTIGPSTPEPDSAAAHGLHAHLGRSPDGGSVAIVRSRRHIRGLRLHVPGLRPSDDAFDLAPGETRSVPLNGTLADGGGHVTALNLRGPLAMTRETAGR